MRLSAVGVGRDVGLDDDGRMQSFYLGPRKPRFTPSSWDDIVIAAAEGLLDEGHWVELKKAIPPKSAGANTELAKDLASLSVDGGALIIGIEDAKGQAGEVTGTDISGLQSRLDATAQARVEPPLTITTQSFVHPTETQRAIMIVTVPASAGAPHMVDKSYWGRGDEGKRALSDHEVRRLLAIRQERAEGFEDRLRRVMMDIGAEPREASAPYLHILAEPSSSPYGKTVTDVLDGMHPLQLFTDAVKSKPQWSPSLHNVHYHVPHPDGYAAKSFRDDTDDDGFRLSILIGDDGSWRVASGAPIQPLGSLHDNSSGDLVFRAGSVLELAHSVFTAIAHLSTEVVPLSTEWQIGLYVTGMRGIYPVEQHSPGHFRDFTAFPREDFLRTTTSTTHELAGCPAGIVERLTRPLLRSMSIDKKYLPYEGIERIGKR